MIKINIDKFAYDSNCVLKDINIDLCAGSISTVLGPSGCGKSTLLRVLMGFEKSEHSTEHKFSLVPQTPHLFPWKTIAKNIEMNIDDSVKKETKQEMQKRISEMLNIVGLLGVENNYPFELSVGMNQRVSFARAMINPFEALLLDEPFSALDALTRKELQNWLLKIVKAQESYCLFVTHDISEAIHLSKNIYILSQKPATIAAHFVKNDDVFTEVNTGKVFKADEMNALEDNIFNLLSKSVLNAAN